MSTIVAISIKFLTFIIHLSGNVIKLSTEGAACL